MDPVTTNAQFGLLRRAARAWHRFWFPEVDPFVVGLFRVGLGGFLLVYYLALVPCWLEFYGPAGNSWELVRPLGEARADMPSLLLHISTPAGMWAFWWTCFGAAALLTLGWGGRLPVAWLWVANISIVFRNYGVTNAEEQVLAVYLFGGLFLPLDRALRVRAPWDPPGGRPRPAKVATWALRWIQVNVAFIYLASWPAKVLSDFAWRDGTVIYYAVGSMAFARWPGLAVMGWGGAALSRLLTLWTLAAELLFPLLVWSPRYRVPLTLSLMLLHVGIAICLEGLVAFSLGMVLGLVTFLPSRRTRELFERWSGRGGGADATAAGSGAPVA